MSAVILVLPVSANPVADVLERERETGLDGIPFGSVVRLEPRRTPVADASTPNPDDPNGPRAA